jgi:hypothetical protein
MYGNHTDATMDAVVQPCDAVAVASGWWEYQRRSVGTREERKALEMGEPEVVQAAHDYVEDAINRGGRSALDLVAFLIDATPPGNDSGAVGAAPLEDLLHAHGNDLVGEIEVYARQRPAFANALAAVWIERGRLSSATEDRLEPWIAGFTPNP